MSKWANEQMRKWANEQVSKWANEQMRNEQMSKWASEQMSKWANEQVSKWANEQVGKWASGQMSKIIIIVWFGLDESFTYIHLALYSHGWVAGSAGNIAILAQFGLELGLRLSLAIRDFNMTDCYRYLFPDGREYTWARKDKNRSRQDRY